MKIEDKTNIGGKDYSVAPLSVVDYYLDEADHEARDLPWVHNEQNGWHWTVADEYVYLSGQSISEVLHRAYPEIPEDAAFYNVIDLDGDRSLETLDIDTSKYSVVATEVGSFQRKYSFDNGPVSIPMLSLDE